MKLTFDALQQTTKRTEKEAILLDNRHQDEFTATLRWLLNPFVVTGISTKKISKHVSVQGLDIQNWKTLMLYLQDHTTGSDADIATVQQFLRYHDKDTAAFYAALVTKSLRIGCDAKTVNKVYGDGFIPTFDVMLGTPYEKVKLKPNEWISISRKMNGIRCVYYRGKMFSRSGKEISGLEHICADLAQLYRNDVQPMVFDGELVLKDNADLSDSEAFQVAVGIANSDAPSKPELKFVLFDLLTEDEFQKGTSKTNYRSRSEVLVTCVEHTENWEPVKIFYQGTDHAQIAKCLEYAEANDMEGVMVNTDAPYQCKRTKNLIKVKAFKDIELRCIGVVEGQGKYAGTTGAVVCAFHDNTVEVGTGLTDTMRDDFWKNPSKVLDKVITVKYKEETKNKDTGKKSLQFPVFVCVRNDKSTPDA